MAGQELAHLKQQMLGLAKTERRRAAEHQRPGAANLRHQYLNLIRIDRLRLPARQAEQHGGIGRVAVSGQGERAEQLDSHAADRAEPLAQPLRKPERGAHRSDRVRTRRTDADGEQLEHADRHRQRVRMQAGGRR